MISLIPASIGLKQSFSGLYESVLIKRWLILREKTSNKPVTCYHTLHIQYNPLFLWNWCLNESQPRHTDIGWQRWSPASRHMSSKVANLIYEIVKNAGRRSEYFTGCVLNICQDVSSNEVWNTRAPQVTSHSGDFWWGAMTWLVLLILFPKRATTFELNLSSSKKKETKIEQDMLWRLLFLLHHRLTPFEFTLVYFNRCRLPVVVVQTKSRHRTTANSVSDRDSASLSGMPVALTWSNSCPMLNVPSY